MCGWSSRARICRSRSKRRRIVLRVHPAPEELDRDALLEEPVGALAEEDLAHAAAPETRRARARRRAARAAAPLGGDSSRSSPAISAAGVSRKPRRVRLGPRGAARPTRAIPDRRFPRGAARAREDPLRRAPRTGPARPSTRGPPAPVDDVLSSWKRNARAVCQWRFKVRTETPEMAAISSTGAAKNRHSTRRASSSSTAPSRSSAASSATSSAARSSTGMSAGVEIERPQAGAPAAALRERARSIRNMRIARAAIEKKCERSGRTRPRRARAQVRLVDERGRRERPLGGSLSQLPVGDLPQLAVEDREEAVDAPPGRRPRPRAGSP